MKAKEMTQITPQTDKKNTLMWDGCGGLWRDLRQLWQILRNICLFSFLLFVSFWTKLLAGLVTLSQPMVKTLTIRGIPEQQCDVLAMRRNFYS